MNVLQLVSSSFSSLFIYSNDGGGAQSMPLLLIVVDREEAVEREPGREDDEWVRSL